MKDKPVYPPPMAKLDNGTVVTSCEVSEFGEGISLREYYAGLAMQGLINLGFKADGHSHPVFTAIDAVEYADALIEELQKKEQGNE